MKEYMKIINSINHHNKRIKYKNNQQHQLFKIPLSKLSEMFESKNGPELISCIFNRKIDKLFTKQNKLTKII